GPNDGGVDIRSSICAQFNDIPLAFQCKNWDDQIGPHVVRELRGVVCEERPGTIGILVGPCVEDFSSDAVDTARTSSYPIILTDKSHLPIILLNLAIDISLRRPFDFSFYYDLITNH
ncbi:6083_t:CDS:2, partial [Ambispora leptoticha]